MNQNTPRTEPALEQALEQALEHTTSGRNASRALIVAGVATGAALTPVMAGIAYSRFMVEHAAPLPLAIEADRREFLSPMAGQISYYAEDEGAGNAARPLVLIHSVNAGASAYEMRPLFDFFRGRRPVYALDLPGYGFSERGDRAYSAEIFTVALLDLLREIHASERGGADVVALSLGCEFAAWAAIHQPAMIHSLALISPTGFAGRPHDDRPQRIGQRNANRRLRNLFAFPLWSQAFYDALVSRASLRYFLQRSFTGEVDPGLLDYGWATTHQPGARFAPLAFISGLLFTPDALDLVYARVTQPTLALYDKDGYTTFDALPDLLAKRPNWQAVRITPTRGLPHFERLGDTARVLQRFWSEVMVPLS